MTLKEFIDEINDMLASEYLQTDVDNYEIVLRKEARNPNETTLCDLDFRNVDHETKTIQLITT